MTVYCKFKSAKNYFSVPINGNFISVTNLKEKIFESKNLGSGTDFDLMVYNAQTNQEYDDEAMLIPRNASVIVRRVPGWHRLPIVLKKDETKCLENNVEENPKSTSSISTADSSTIEFLSESKCYDFGIDLFSEVVPFQSRNPVRDALSNMADEDRKIKDLVDTPALGCQQQAHEASVFGRGLKSGIDSRNGQIGGFVSKKPPQGYICRRCKIAGHFIQHCPTNGDPDFDIKRLKPPKGIPKSMLMETLDGSYALPSGAVAILKPNEATFEKEIEGIPSVRPVINVPPELHCPLCKEVMNDAVLSSKCCFNSFCDKCIRDHIISKSMCVCGSMKMLADDLLPNKTIRETINRILGSTTRSAFSGSSVLVQDIESACSPQPKVLLPTVSAPTKEECATPLCENHTLVMQETRKQGKTDLNMLELSSEKSRATKNISRSEVIIESVCVREATSQQTAPQAKEEVQQKLPVGEKGHLQWKISEAFVAENYVMPFGPPACNPFLGGMQMGVYGDIMHYSIPMPPYMGYTSGVFCHQDPYGVGGYGYTISTVPQSQREFSNHGEFDMEVSNGADTTSIKLKPGHVGPWQSYGEVERLESRKRSLNYDNEGSNKIRKRKLT
ncbi:hypothetical protein AAC387_Pa08g1400 [Persea americana]